MRPRAYAVATMDTKGRELSFVADRIRAAGVEVVTVDVGTLDPPTVGPDIPREAVVASHPTPEGRAQALSGVDRGRSVTAMGEALAVFLRREHEAGRLAGVIGIGGSGNTAAITPAMRALPIGMPKVMVSTIASGNVSPYVGTSDIVMMYPVVDKEPGEEKGA